MGNGAKGALSDLTILVPAWNEARTILQALERIRTSLPGATILVIDDGSTDGTSTVLEPALSPSLQLLRLEANGGKGLALRLGVESGVIRTPFFAILDADLDLNPEGIAAGHQLLKSDTSLAGAIGSKLHPQSQLDYAWYRRWMSLVFRIFLRILFPLRVSDTQTGLKVFRTREVAPLVSGVFSEGWTFDLELLLLMHDRRMRVVEIPISLEYQFNSSIDMANGLKAIRDTLMVWRRRKRYRSLSGSV